MQNCLHILDKNKYIRNDFKMNRSYKMRNLELIKF